MVGGKQGHAPCRIVLVEVNVSGPPLWLGVSKGKLPVEYFW